MSSHSKEQENPTTTLSVPDIKSDSECELNTEEDDEKEMKEWLSARYSRESSNPMKEPLTAPWNLPLSASDFSKLTAGLRARDMDKRWEILVEDPDETGGISVHIFRSWLHEDCYILHIVQTPSKDESSGGVIIESITWEGNKAGLQCDAEQAKIEAVMVARSQVQCEFESLPHYPLKMMWQKSGYKRLSDYERP